jgi:hypothetical protein
LIVHPRVQIDHARQRRLCQHGVVEGIVARHALAAAQYLRVQEPALAHAMLVAKRALQFREDFVDRDRGEKAEAAQIHRE